MARKRPQTRNDHDHDDDTTTTGPIDIRDAPDPATATPEQARRYNNRSVERVVSMLNALQESSAPMSLVEIHRSIRHGESHRVPLPLDPREAPVRRTRRTRARYRLGLGFVGMQSRDLDVLKERARPWLERLRDDTGETANLGVLDGNAVRYVDVAESHRTVRMSSPSGSRDPLYCTALGKAIAALLPEEQVRELLEQVELTPRTASTITSVDDYLHQLTLVQQQGFAVDDGENEADGRCVAVAIPGIRLPAALERERTVQPLHRQGCRKGRQVAVDVAHRLQPTGHG